MSNLVFWSGLSTVTTLVVFIAVVIWAMSSKRRKSFEEAANLPLEDDVIKSSNDKDNRE